MKTTLYLLLAVGLLSGGCGSKQPAPAAAKATNETTTATGNPLTAPVDYLGAINQANKTAVKTIELVSVRQAIQQFYNMEDRFPTDLNELVTKHYLGRMPALPAGMKLLYNQQNGEVTVVRQ